MTITSIPNAVGVYRISLKWSNSYLLTEEGSCCSWLIDTGLQDDRQALIDALAHHGHPADKVSCVLLTHGHCDHAGNAAFFATTYGCKLYAHTRELPFLVSPSKPYGPQGRMAFRRPMQFAAFRSGERLFPVERFNAYSELDEGNQLGAPGGELQVVLCPGHSPGHIAFYRKQDGVLFCGDSILNVRPHVIQKLRREGLSLPVKLFSTDWSLVKQSARKLSEIKPNTLLSGHGRPLVENTALRIETWVASLR